MTDAELDAYAQQIADASPPLNAEQQAVIRRVFGQPVAEESAA